MSELAIWLNELGLSKYLTAFSENEVVFSDIPDLTEEDLKEIGLPVGPRRRLLKAAQALLQESEPTADPRDPESVTATAASMDRRPSSEAERRQLTVMFVDLVGSTALSERLDPEEMRDAITGFQNTVAGVVTRFEGNVAKYMGDGVLCYFGWPRAHEDDAERSVRAAIGVIQALEQSDAVAGEELSARAGIATGLVVVGDLVGEGGAQEDAVIGSTPNLAARLQALAEPGQLVIAEATKRLVGELFEFDKLGALSLKGIAAPVNAFVVTGERLVEARFDAQHTGTVAKMIGREQELALLLDRWRQAESGEGQMVLLIGEAGIGKSRIARGLFDALRDTDHIHIRYQCSPYHTDSALFPTTQQLSLAAGFHADDTPEERLDLLDRLLARANVDLARASPLIASLLGLGEAAEAKYGALGLSAQQRRLATLEALVDQLSGLSKSSPVLFTVEDVHWIDPTTLELIERCLDRIDDMSVLVLATARPTFVHGFGGHPSVTRLALNRLGRVQVREIIDRVTKGKAIPSALLDEIAARTDGVPLFVEELTKTILESPALRETDDAWVLDGPIDAIAIPTSLHDSLMARLDRLQPIKEVAQTAACIGREFEHRLLSKISPLASEDLDSALNRLIEAELLFRRGAPPDATYLFKHALVRDAAYESLLKSSRKQVHARIASALQAGRKSGERVEPAVLAHHCQEAALTEKAIKYWREAGELAVGRSANIEAIAHLRRGIGLVQALPETVDRHRLELTLQTMLAGPMIATNGYGGVETGAVFERAQTLSEQVEDPALLFPVLYQQWVYNVIGGRIANAQKRAQSFITLAEDQCEPGPKVLGHRINAVSLFYRGELAAARQEFRLALSLYDGKRDADLKLRFGQDPRAACLSFLAATEYLLGNPEDARACAVEALEQATEARHVNTLAYALFFGPMAEAILRRDVQLAGRYAKQLQELAAEQGLTMWAGYGGVCGAWVMAQQGGAAEAVELAEHSLAKLEETRTALDHPKMMCLLAEIHASDGRHQEADRLLDDAIGFAERTGDRWYLAECHRLEGRALLALGKVGAAEAYQRAIKVAEQQGAKSWRLRAVTDLARLLSDSGKRDRAIELLLSVSEDCSEGATAPELRDAVALLGELS